MSRHLLRIVSATLVALFAVLTSAAAVCLLPCELTPAVHTGATGPKVDHCAGAAGTESAGEALAGTDQSCSDQHGWDGPAADRLASRASIAPGIAVIPPAAAPAPGAEVRTHVGSLARLPAAPPPLLVPLRI